MEETVHMVMQLLDREGWAYERLGDDLLLLASFRTRKWKLVISCETDGRVGIFAVYPWKAPKYRTSMLLEGVNALNLTQRRGCFMVNPGEGEILYRCGIQILEEYAGREAVENLLLTSVAAVNANWDTVYGLIMNTIKE